MRHSRTASSRTTIICTSTPGVRMAAGGDHDEFVLQVIDAQTRIYAYILSLVLDRDRARDILQQTNLVMLQKEPDFEHGTNFVAWAYRVAFYEVLADRRSRQRDKHLFSDELLALVAARVSESNETLDDRVQALENCLKDLPTEHRTLIVERYRTDGKVKALAEQQGKTPAAVSAMLYRIRSALLECVERKLGGATTP